MTDHFSWIWLIIFIFPLAKIAQRYFRKHRMQNSSNSSENIVGMQFEKTSTDIMEKPVRNLAKPETKDILILGELNRGVKNFDRIQKITGFERDELISILEDLEKRNLMRVEQKSGLFGSKVELYVTDKGIKEYYS